MFGRGFSTLDIVGFTALFSTRIGAYGCCLSFCVSVLSDGKTLPAVAVSCECGLHSFSALQKFVPVQSDVAFSFGALLFLCAAPGGTLSHTLPGLCPRPRQGLPRPWMGGMRFAVGFTALFSPPTACLCRPHFVGLGGVRRPQDLGGVGRRGTPLPGLMSAV